jgi:hypothetical protein
MPAIPGTAALASQLLNIWSMRVGGNKEEQAWKPRIYPVPKATRRGFRWRASVLRTLDRWNGKVVSTHPATIMVPALYNFMPAECVAQGWLNEIDTLVTIRHRMACAARITGWDVFTFHTLHNADHFFDTTIAAVRDTWLKEGSLSAKLIQETRRRFGKPYSYHRIHARLVENLVFQSTLLDWIGYNASDVPLRLQVTGTALLSALVSTGSVSFSAAVESAMKIGVRWDEALRGAGNGKTEDEAGWSEFRQIRSLLEGTASISMAVSSEDLPAPDAPARPFWYSPTINGEPMLITTAQEAANALETLNLVSWATVPPKSASNTAQPVRGWLVSSLHPMARHSRLSLSNCLLATPASVTLFLDHIATLVGRQPVAQSETEPLQNRFRLSRIKVTGP